MPEIRIKVETIDAEGFVLFDLQNRRDLSGKVTEVELPGKLQRMWEERTEGGNPFELVYGGGTSPDDIDAWFDGVMSVLTNINRTLKLEGGLGLLISTDKPVESFSSQLPQGVVG